MDMNSSGIPDFSAIPMTMTVTELNEYVKMSFEANPVLGDIYVKGEISNFKNHYKTGHYYFTLKDEGGNLRAVMFRSYSSRLAFVPEDGMKVIAHGRVTVFVRDGQYQLYVDSMEPDGIGALY
ncbi:MAG TPA: exodeoxyribonuclease VII large subunit, partial [Bacillota bacterium]|nr:exodeoxyribonuclease VII large subunit [Bacillota bacterium]